MTLSGQKRLFALNGTCNQKLFENVLRATTACDLMYLHNESEFIDRNYPNYFKKL